MPRKNWTAKRAPQDVHIEEGLLDRRRPQPVAEAMAARVVNKERARQGESAEASPSSVNDMPALPCPRLPKGRTHAAQALQTAWPFIDARARLELDFRRSTP
jgi:hypothetical protein